MALEIVDLAVARVDALARYEFMHPGDEDVFVMRAVEDADHAERRHRLVDAPQEIVGELGRRRLLEARGDNPLRIDGPKDAADRAVLAARVDALEHDEQ